MATDAQTAAVIQATKPSQPKPQAAPAPAPKAKIPAATSMGNGLAKLIQKPIQAAKASADAMKKQAEEGSIPLDQELASDQEQLHQYSAQMHQVTQAMQRQRMITVNTAQVMRKVLPVVGIFALIGGLTEGMAGAMTALAGGLAGLSQGLNDRYQMAFKQYNAEAQKMLAQRKDIQDEMKSIRDDERLTINQKVDLWKTAAQGNKAYLSALSSGTNTYAHMLNQIQVEDMRLHKTKTAQAQAVAVSTPPSPDEVAQMHGALHDKPGKGNLSAQQGAQLAKILMGTEGLNWEQAKAKVASYLKFNNLQGHPLTMDKAEEHFGIDQSAIQGAQSGYTSGAVTALASEVISGAKSINTIVGYSGKKNSSIRQAIMNRANEMLHQAGVNPGDLPLLQASYKARETALTDLQKKSSFVSAYNQSLDGNLDKLQRIASQMKLTSFPSWNAVELAARKQEGDPRVSAYAQALLDVQADYGKVLSMNTGASGVSDTQLRVAMDALPGTASLPALDASINQLRQSANIITASLKHGINQLSSALQTNQLGQQEGSDQGTAPASSGAADKYINEASNGQ